MGFDLAIIGGGIVGATIAALARIRRPLARIALLEQHLVGTGASLYGGALRVPLGTSRTHRALTARSEDLFRAIEAWGGPLPGRPLPIVWIVPATRREAFAGCLTGASEAAGPATRRALEARVPGLALDPGDVVLTGPPAWHGNPGATARRLVGALRRQAGFVAYEGFRVAAVDVRPDGCDVVGAGGDVLRSRQVVRATGPWLALPGAGAQPAGLRTKKVSALHVDLAARDDDPAIVFVDDDAYLLPDPDSGRWIFCISSDEWDVAPQRSGLGVSGRDRAIAARVLGRHAPALTALCRGGRVFCDGYTDDRLPLVACDPGTQRLVHALGGSGAGYRFAPAMAEQALALLGLEPGEAAEVPASMPQADLVPP